VSIKLGAYHKQLAGKINFMPNLTKHLITTADERTWLFGNPVLFLGEWCHLYDRRSIWMNMNSELASPLKFEVEEKSNRIDYLHNLKEKLLTELAAELNAFHDTDHSFRYWNILLGHWIKRYVDVCSNRYYTIEKVLKNYKIISTTVLHSPGFRFAKHDSLSFVQACDNDIWNNMFYARVLEHMDIQDIDLYTVDIENQEECKLKESSAIVWFQSPIKWVRNIIRNISPKLCKNTDAFIINSYLPKWQEIALYLSLWQWPQFWQSPTLVKVSVDPKARKKLVISSEGYFGFENFVRDLLADIIPTCYLEGYTKLNNQAESLAWPSKPSFIFTSNNFDTDEIFKAWTGIRTEQGVPYFVGQHGNNYGTILGSPSRTELLTATNFFSWGCLKENANNIQAFVLKTYNLDLRNQHDGGILLLELHAPALVEPDDIYFEFGIYQEQQFQFVEALPLKIQKELTVRLHDGWVNTRWSDDKRWRDHASSIALDPGTDPVKNSIAKNRLVVHSYDSTGILEGLASNIPTLCFWNGGLDHLLPIAKPYYDLLRSAGILADSPEHAAQLVAQYWDNIDGWWGSEQVQDARLIFCEQYARVEKCPVRAMKRLLTSAVLNQNN
jgi:putative transferase (TIGR04331 family)